MMRTLLLLVFGLWFLNRPASAQEPAATPPANVLVACGDEKIAVLDGTASPDGHYVLGWTLRPHAQKPPMDWSGYDPANPMDILDKVSWNEEDPAKGDYTFFDGVIDLAAKQFIPCASTFPYWPHKNHGNLAVAWSENMRGSRYVLISNDARFYTYNLWLVRLVPGSPQVTDLSTAGEAAATAYMRKRDPKDYSRYGITFEPSTPEGGEENAATIFREDSVTVHFDASVPKSDVDNDDGNITFALPKGTVLRVTKK